jgi:membrane protease subunit HflC
MERLWQEQKAAIIAAVVVIVAALSCLIVVPETKQAVVVRLGDPVRVINKFKPGIDFGMTGAGLTWRLPFFEQVVWVDKRVLSVDMARQQVLSSDQQRLEVDAYARFRIIDPVRMVQTAGSTERVAEQLQPILNSVLRQELGKRTFGALLTADRGAAMEKIRLGLDKQAREYGAQVIDVRIKQADLPNGTPLESAFTRMVSARRQAAATITAQGQKSAQIIRAEAEAQASKTYAASFGKDPAFYDFYRAMQSYDATFAQKDSQTSIILSPDNEYLRQFRGN